MIVYARDKRGVLGPGNNHKRTLHNNSFYSTLVLGDEYNLIIPTANLPDGYLIIYAA